MNSYATIRKHIRELRVFIDRPTSAENAPENLIRKRLAYLIEVVLRYETEKTVGWRKPLAEVLAESNILLKELQEILKK
jgi:hypothetical protein